MGVWLVGADALARSRFLVSPLIETVAALKALNGHPTLPSQRAWIDTHRPALRARLAGDPFAAAFVAAAFRPKWVADFVVTPPDDAGGSFAAELDRVRATPADAVRAELAAENPRPLPAVLDGPDLAERAADLLDWVWERTLRADWPRRRRLLEADIVARTQRLGAGGWAMALDGMRPGMRWLGSGQLQINGYDHPTRDLAGARLLFVPSTCRRGWVGWDEPHRYVVVYPCAGVLADPAAALVPEALGRLLGPVRAAILGRLDAPMTPTQLVAATGFSLGSVGGHLKVLRDAQLVRRRRSGRAVLYYRTEAGDRLARLEPR